MKPYAPSVLAGVLFLAIIAAAGCGYTTRPGLAPHLKTVYVRPFTNEIDVTRIPSSDYRFPIYRHGMEVDLTNRVIERYQFTGLLRPVSLNQADCLLEGELVEFRRDALRYDASQQVEEWRLSVVVNLTFKDLKKDVELWHETRFTGDTTYFSSGVNAESEAAALDRAMTDLARRIVERSVEDW